MLAQILQTASVVIAAATFVYGVGSWRRTVLGQKRVDLAVEGIIAFREVEQAFREVRSPFGSANEGATRQRRMGETDGDAELGRRAYVAIERLNHRSEKFAKLQSLKYRFEAYYGKDALAPFDETLTIRNDIIRASFGLEIHWKKQGQPFASRGDFEAHLDRMHSAQAIIWEGYGDPDPIAPRIDRVIRQAEEICRDVIEPGRNIAVLGKSIQRRFASFWLRK